MEQALNISYRFIFPNNREELIEVKIDKQTMKSLPDDSVATPDWCRLGFHQCPNCLLRAEEHADCPLAIRLVRLMAACQNVLSHDEVRMEVVTPERTVLKNTTAQRGVSSLMGLEMATSGCPRMAFLRPMARYHLPFATQEETIFRVVSTYLLEQYFRHKHAQEVDLDLQRLKGIYTEIQVVNKTMTTRLRTAGGKDSAVNAMVLLDIFAKLLPYSIEDSLEDIRYLFLQA